MADRATVLLSERLGPVTSVEQRVEIAGAEVLGAPLWTLPEIREHGATADIIILGAVEPFDGEALASLPMLRAIVRRGVGTDNVDLDMATELGIVVAHVTDASVEEVSDHALALLVTIERRVRQLDAGVRSGAWSHDTREVTSLRQPIRRLRTLALGIVGFGRIGQALARKARPLYDRIVVSDPVMDEPTARARAVDLVPLDELFVSADHVSLHAPLNSQTRHMVGQAVLATMRAGSVLVNTARGGLVDESALLEAVRSGHLAGAGLDVTEREPLLPEDPLLGEPNVVLTAHSAASSQSASSELAARSVDAALAILDGQMPPAIANPDVLTRPTLRVNLMRETQD